MRLHLVDIVADRIDRGAHRFRRQLRAFALAQDQLRPVEEKARRAAFVGLDMRFFVADHSAMRLA